MSGGSLPYRHLIVFHPVCLDARLLLFLLWLGLTLLRSQEKACGRGIISHRYYAGENWDQTGLRAS